MGVGGVGIHTELISPNTRWEWSSACQRRPGAVRSWTRVAGLWSPALLPRLNTVPPLTFLFVRQQPWPTSSTTQISTLTALHPPSQIYPSKARATSFPSPLLPHVRLPPPVLSTWTLSADPRPPRGKY